MLEALLFRPSLLSFISAWLGTLGLALLLFSSRRASTKLPPRANGGIYFISDILVFLARPVQFVKQATGKHGSVFRIDCLVKQIFYLRGQKWNRFFLEMKEDTWSFSGGIGMFLNKAANPGYFTHGRNLLGSINRGVNRSAALQSYGRLAGEEAHKSLQHWSQMPDVEIFESVSRFVHRVIVRCMMGEDFYDHHVDELYDLLQQMESLVGHPFNLLLPSWVPHLPGRQLAQARNRFAEIFRERLAARQLESDVWHDSLDYINYTLNDPRTAQLADYYPSHHVVLMFAAHTSTVASIAWTIVELLRHPIYQEEIRESLATMSDIHQCAPLLACLREEGRRYSGVHMFRTTKRPVSLEGSDYTVPEKSVVLISPYLTHHDPAIYPEPHEYQPHRWLLPDGRLNPWNGSKEAAFLQFGAGNHRCPGENFAAIIAREFLAALLMKYEIEWGRDGAPADLSRLDFTKVGSPWLEGDAAVRIRPRVFGS
ncbi:cytochrome P450 [Aspergillus flavus]|nr:cytochrome P450 [Aspergillus flavus]